MRENWEGIKHPIYKDVFIAVGRLILENQIKNFFCRVTTFLEYCNLLVVNQSINHFPCMYEPFKPYGVMRVRVNVYHINFQEHGSITY